MSDTRIGFVGAGFMGQLAHLRNYDRVEDCEVVALAEPRTELAASVAQRYDIPETYDDHEGLLAEADVDAVVAAQPYQRHKYIVPDILEAGVGLFNEKPLAVTPGTAADLADAAEAAGVVHMVGYHKRSDPAMEYAKDVVEEWRESGDYGPMRFVRVTMPEGDWIAGAPDPISTDEEPPAGEFESLPAEFDDEAGEAYNAFINYYIHQVNALHFFFGEGYDVAYADDAGTLLVAESESGVTGTLEQSPYKTSDDWQESVLVGFERGYVRVELPPPLTSQRAGRVEVMRYDDGTETVSPTMPSKAAMRRQAENFVAAVEGRRDPPCSSREAVADLEVAKQYIRRRYE